MLARYDFRGWPNGDDAAVMRGGQIAFFLSAHSFFFDCLVYFLLCLILWTQFKCWVAQVFLHSGNKGLVGLCMPCL